MESFYCEKMWLNYVYRVSSQYLKQAFW